MVSKKYKLIIALCGLIQTATFAQDQSTTTTSSTDANWVYDSSKVSSKDMAQYNEFQNYLNPYPPKPRSMWELSLGGGHGLVVGDRPFLSKDGREEQPIYNGGLAGGISVRKAISHVFSLRAGYNGSIINVPRYKDYQTYVQNQTHSLTMEMVASLNTISSFRGNPKTNWYAFAGYAGAATHLLGREDEGDDWRHLVTFDPNNQLNNQRNTAFTFGSVEPDPDSRFGDDNKEWKVWHGVSTGGGIAFKLSPRVNFAFEEKFIIPLTGLDNLDGYVGGKSNDFLAYSLLKLNFNIGNASTHTEPLWWINPNNYLYNEVATPRHMKLPPVVLPDADGDGITDQFDLEPNTPAGCPVDSHGVTRDTDGDGVPDCRDKEVLTPQSCFPVNADGVGNCPCPNDSCFAGRVGMGSCAINSLPSVTFSRGTASLSSSAQSILNGVAQQLNANPGCNVRVIGYGASDKRSQQLSWDHVNSVIKYLSEKQGISESRLIFSYGMDGDANSVDLQPTAESGPNTVPAPHPQYKKN